MVCYKEVKGGGSKKTVLLCNQKGIYTMKRERVLEISEDGEEKDGVRTWKEEEKR